MLLSILKYVSFIVFTGLASLSPVYASTSPLINAPALKQKLGQENVVVLEIQPLGYYQQAHIPGSVQTDYANWRQRDAQGLGSMLPEQAQLETLIGDLGIDNQSEVIIVPVGRGADDMAAASRIYWTLYVAGLEQISILKGGLLAYYNTYGRDGLEEGNSLSQARPFSANFRLPEIVDMETVSRYLEKGYSIVDARSHDEYTGRVAGSPTERPGALPRASNLPFDSLMDASGDDLLDIETLRKRFSEAGIPLQGNQLSYCHTGHRTSLVWFVSHELLGNKQARLYDGSTLEWSSTGDRPLVTHLDEVPPS